MKISEKLLNMSPYDPTENKYSVKLDANESFIELPPVIKAKMLSAIAEVAENRYPDPSCRVLREAASKIYNVPDKNIVCGNGSDELLSIIISSFNMKGDKIMTAAPDFSMYEFYAHNAECEVVTYEKDDALVIDPNELISMAKEQNVNMLIFSNPCNPTGVGLPASDIKRIVSSLDSLVVVDEAYMEFWNESILDSVLEYDNCILLRTCSKAFGMAALRVGFAIANDILISCMNKSRSPFNVSALVQAGAASVLSEREYLEECCEKIRKNTEELRHMALELTEKNQNFEYMPTVTNFVLLKTKKAKEYYNELLGRDICVRLVKGKYLRITSGSADENRIVMDALAQISER